MKSVRLLILLLTLSSQSFAWDGWDYQQGGAVEIEKGNTVREGEDIEYYDYSKGGYRNATVESVERSGGSVDVEVYDQDDGEYRTLEMDAE